MTDQLSLYRKAARHLSQEEPATLVEDTQVVRKLNFVYAEAVQEILEAAIWLFARRTVELTYDPAIDTSTFGGLNYGFTLPSDYVRIARINTSPYFTPNSELGDYDITGPGKTLYTDEASFYLQYISNGTTYGLNLGAWPETLAEAGGYLLAFKTAIPVNKDHADRNDLMKLYAGKLAEAKVRNAVDERVKAKPVGRLVRSRFRQNFNRALSDFDR